MERSISSTVGQQAHIYEGSSIKGFINELPNLSYEQFQEHQKKI